MSLPRPVLVVAAALVALLIALATWVLRAPPPPEPPPPPTPAKARRSPGQSTPLPRPAAAKKADKPARRPTPPPAEAPSAPDAPPAQDDAAADDPDTGRPLPSRTLTPDNARDLLPQVMHDEVAPEILACMEDWRTEFPDANGRVVMNFKLDALGLKEASIAEYTDLPTGLLSCVSAAVWEGDWPAYPEGELEVNYPITLIMGMSTDDPGPVR